MSKRNIGIATGSSIFELLSHYAVKDAWTGGLSRFLITVSLRSKGSMDHTNVFRFVNVLYSEHKYQSTSDGHKSHLCFPIIANRKTNRRWFGSLFVFPTDTKRESNRRHVQNRLFFCFFNSYLMLQMKNDHISIFPFLFLNWVKGKGNLITLFLFSIMESENEKRKDGIYNTWLFSVYPVFILQ